MPKKFDQDAKDRVVRLVEDRILAENISTQEACKIVAPKLGVSWHTARQWTQAARREGRVVELKALQRCTHQWSALIWENRKTKASNVEY
ncbi:transposase [Corynebacterium diphtheriae]|uniref:Transposase n=2 Tax=Corynebacterium diphtheriae TaxID=1717 RepID=Q6NJF1_CORDI|nr:hypothetical protein [Corynebacterium diphtheriae]OWN06646.1 transposase [Corynebacterium belfantii]AEX47913.1 transposase-like protein [Corynebacterium diphtheriae BH8]ARB88757.1 transposase [Corynebacterium diphtheriae]KKA82274.1 transposase [Corynebacterium diphtheriae]KLN42312.1 transposase [Corynebacterium diphtheriae bv. gravis str. ISS 4060]